MFTEKLRSQELWYAILVRMGRENSVKDQILEKEKELVPADLIVPEQPKNYLTDRDMTERYKDFSGYIFIKLMMNIFRYNILLQLDNVYRFLGTVHSDGKLVFYVPSYIPEQQINNVKRYLKGETDIKKSTKTTFSIGDKVEIISGDLASIQGKIVSLSNNTACISPECFFGQTIKVPLEKVCICD